MIVSPVSCSHSCFKYCYGIAMLESIRNTGILGTIMSDVSKSFSDSPFYYLDVT